MPWRPLDDNFKEMIISASKWRAGHIAVEKGPVCGYLHVASG